MAKVWNPTEEKVVTKIFGNFFEFKPGQMKSMNKHLCDFIAEQRQSTGLVVLPAEFGPEEDNDAYIEGFEKTPEGKAILAEKKAAGIAALVKHHLGIVYNNQVSLRRDLSRHDPGNADPSRLASIEASKGEIESMRIVAKYKAMKLDGETKKASEVEKLMNEIGPVGQ